MKYRSPTAAVFILAACTPMHSGVAPEAPRISAARLAEDVRTVSSDAYLGRGPATQGEELATSYIRDQLKALTIAA